MKKIITSTQETIRAAQLSRRTLLKSAAAIGAVGLTSPLYIKRALSSSGELNLLMWSDEYPKPVLENFEKASGIKVNQTPFSQNEEQINKLQATGGEGFDLCSPTQNRAPQYKDLAVLAPFDMNKVKNHSAIIPSMSKAAADLWTWDGGLYYMPHCWGSEAISYRTDLYKGDPKDLSYGSLWGDDVRALQSVALFELRAECLRDAGHLGEIFRAAHIKPVPELLYAHLALRRRDAEFAETLGHLRA